MEEKLGISLRKTVSTQAWRKAVSGSGWQEAGLVTSVLERLMMGGSPDNLGSGQLHPLWPTLSGEHGRQCTTYAHGEKQALDMTEPKLNTKGKRVLVLLFRYSLILPEGNTQGHLPTKMGRERAFG